MTATGEQAYLATEGSSTAGRRLNPLVPATVNCARLDRLLTHPRIEIDYLTADLDIGPEETDGFRRLVKDGSATSLDFRDRRFGPCPQGGVDERGITGEHP